MPIVSAVTRRRFSAGRCIDDFFLTTKWLAVEKTERIVKEAGCFVLGE
jgi:hypothetical protein